MAFHKPQLFAEVILTDEIDIEKLAALKQRDATLWEKIKEFFTDLLEKLVGIIDAYDGISAETAEGKFVAELGKEYKRLQGLFTEALYDASNTYSTVEKTLTDAAQFSLRDKVIPTREELERKDPVKVVDISTPKTTGTFSERRRQILKDAQEIIKKPYLNEDTQTFIFLTEKSYTHAFSNKGELQINAAEHLPEFIQNAILTHAEQPTHGSKYANGIYTFFAAAKQENILPVKLKVKEIAYSGQDIPANIKAYFEENSQDYVEAYDTVVLEVEEIERSPLGSAMHTNQNESAHSPNELPAIKVADLLNLVNSSAQKYIPQKVETRNSSRGTDNTSNGEKLTNALKETAQTDEIERTLPKTEEEIEATEGEQADRDLESDLYNSGVKYSLRGYTEKQKDNWKNSKRIVLFENNQQYREFIKKSKEDVQYNKKIYFGAISEDLASLIRENTKIEVEGFNCSLSSYEIRKMFKDHGNSAIEEPRGQRAITEDDIVNIPLVIQSPDVVDKSPNEYNGKPAILFQKNFTQNEKTTVVAVVSDKHIDLFVQTSYVGVKKGNLATPIGEQAPINTPGANSGTVSSSKISQRESDVNNSLLGSDNTSIGTTVKYQVRSTSVEQIEKENYDHWKSIEPATRAQSTHLDLTDDRNVARYRLEIDDVMRNKSRTNVMVGMPNDLLLKYGFKEAPIYIEANDVVKMAYPYGYLQTDKTKNRHNLGFSVIKNLVYQIADPVGITENTLQQQKKHAMRGTTSRIIFTEWIDKSGNPIIVPITIGVNNRISVPDDAIKNIVNTAFGAEEAYLKSLENVKVLYPENKKDISALFTDARQTSLPESSSDDIFASNIYEDEVFVNNSLRESDNLSNRELLANAHMGAAQADEIEQTDNDLESDAGVKYSQRVSKKDLPIDDARRYTQTTYDKYGWAYVCGALSPYSGQAFLKAINETVVGIIPAVYNRYGDLKIVVGSDENHFDNVLIYCDEPRTTSETTVIHAVYVINDTNRTDIENIMEGIDGDPLQSSIIEDLFEDGIINVYEKENQQSFSEARRERDEKIRRNGKGNLGDSENLQKRERSSSEDEGTLPDDGVKLSLRETDNLSNRELLANALMEIAQTVAEKEKLEQYKAKVNEINELENHLKEVNAKIKEISFSKGKRDQAALRELKEEKIKTENRINIFDKQLLRIEASKPLRDILTRERQNFKKAQAESQKAFKNAQSEWNKALKTAQGEGKRTLKNAQAEWREAFKKAQAEGRELAQQARAKEREKSEKLIKEIMQRNKELRENSVDKRRRTQMRNKIKNNVSELRTLLYNGNKKRHVKEGMRGAVEQALLAAEFLFEDGYISNEDLVKTMPAETIGRVKGLTEYRDLVSREEDIQAEIKETADVTKRSNLVGELKKVKNKISALSSKLADFFVEERRGRAHAEMDNVIQAMSDAYRGLNDSEYGYIRAAYDENVQQAIDNLKKDLSGTVIKDMSLPQLSEVHNVFKMMVHTVRTANKAFAANIKETRDQLASNAMDEVIATGKEHGYESDMRGKFNRYVWNNLKPVYAFEKIGSPTLTKLFNNIRKGEDVWAIDVADAKKFRNTIVNRFGYDNWDTNDMRPFTSTSGDTFKLNLEQRMSIYAYSKREQAIPHLKNGGFVFDNNELIEVDGKKVRSSSAKAYNLSEETIGKINASLTADQKNFVDLMQGYLSDVMGAKGNEVSMALYGIEQYKEKYYFPLKSAQQYMPKAKEQSKVPAKTKNYGFTKDVVQKAKNPVILTGFMDTWASHVNEMSMYHAFTLPMEDFYRVYNYTTPNMENMESVSVQATIENAFGNAATNYIDQLLDDLNGGARADGREWMLKGLLGKFKKAAVFASASVVIQQPSAIGRAFAIIDHKYFLPNDVTNHNETWAEVKKYAPIAIIKEMGYFDTDMGRSTVDFINSKEYKGAKQKLGAFIKDSDFRDEALSKAPALADEITWCAIWKAVKRETVSIRKDLKINSKEFLEVCGDRFTEVITKTQVYDSVLSRSANMRSKSGLMKMVTAFMAEPTTTINMMEDALRKFRNGDRKAGLRIARSVAEATIINAILVSFVYAMRDDDDDETFLEKYLQSFTSEIIDGFNPLTYLPVIKDVWSIAQGYDVERSDMSIVSDAVGALNSLTKAIENGEGVVDALWQIADSAGSIFGLPVKNIRRDINGVINTVGTFSSDATASNGAMWDGIVETIKNATPVWGWLKDASKTDKLYKAILSGDDAYVKRLERGYKDQKAIDAAIRTGLKENDSRIKDATQALYDGDLELYKKLAKEVIADGFKQDDVVAAINALYDKLKPEEENSSSTTDETDGFFKMEHFVAAIERSDMADAEIIKRDIIETMVLNGKTQEAAEESFMSRASSSVRESYIEGNITYDRAIDVLIDYAGKTEEDATSKVREWDFEIKYGFSWSDRGDAYKSGAVSADELKNILMEVGGKTEEEAELQIQVFEWQKEVPGCDEITASAIADYNDWCAGVGVSKEVYYDAWRYYNDTYGDVDADGKSIPYSKTVKVMPYIDSLPLTSEQKTALALCWWGESTVRKYKLW